MNAAKNILQLGLSTVKNGTYPETRPKRKGSTNPTYSRRMIKAHRDDQRLDLYSLEMENWWQALTLLPSLIRGNYVNCRGIRTLQGTKFELHTPKPCPMDLDGEAMAQTPAYFHLLPQALSVFVP